MDAWVASKQRDSSQDGEADRQRQAGECAPGSKHHALHLIRGAGYLVDTFLNALTTR